MTRWRSNYAFALHRDDESRWSEAKLILGSFLIILLVGTLFLVQPSSHNGEVSFINALFTATSAISVTGESTSSLPLATGRASVATSCGEKC